MTPARFGETAQQNIGRAIEIQKLGRKAWRTRELPQNIRHRIGGKATIARVDPKRQRPVLRTFMNERVQQAQRQVVHYFKTCVFQNFQRTGSSSPRGAGNKHDAAR